MTPDRIDHSPDGEPENGILSDSENLDTIALGIVGGTTEQVSVSIPVSEDDDLDDDVIDDELAPEALGALGSDHEAVGDDVDDARTAAAHDEARSEDTYPETGEIVTGEIVDAEMDADDLTPATGAGQRENREIETGEIVTGEIEATEIEPAAAAHPDSDTATAEWASVAGEDGFDLDAEVSDVDGELVDVETQPAGSIARFAFPASSGHTRDGASPADVAAQPVFVAPAPEPPASPAPPVALAPVASSPAPVASSAVPLSGAPDDAARAAAAPAASAGTPAPTTSGPLPTTRREREAMHAESDRLERAHAVERVQTHPEVNLTSKRLGEFEAGRESSDLLTPDRLLDPHQIVRPEPEGAWQHFVYSLTGHRVNLGDGRKARDRKALDRRISVPLQGGARFVPVLSRKGGVGKTTVTTLLGMALADARDDRIIAIDANPDRGTLAERIARTNGKTIRDLVRMKGAVSGYSDISSIVARDETRLDVLASDADPRVSEALNDRDYLDVASIAAHYYSIVLTDTGTGIVHSVMSATLDAADQFVIVSGLSIDEARLASETLTWLETNGYAEQARNAIVVLNSARPGAPLVRQEELEAHFGTRVRAVVRVPYDPLIAAGSAITFRDLQPGTRLAARALAASVVEGLRALASAA